MRLIAKLACIFAFLALAGCYVRTTEDRTKSIQTKQFLFPDRDTLSVLDPFVYVGRTDSAGWLQKIDFSKKYSPLSNMSNYTEEGRYKHDADLVYSYFNRFLGDTVPWTLVARESDTLINRFYRISAIRKVSLKKKSTISDALYTLLFREILSLENKLRYDSVAEINLSDKICSALRYTPGSYFLITHSMDFYTTHRRGFNDPYPNHWTWLKVFVFNKKTGKAVYYDNYIDLWNEANEGRGLIPFRYEAFSRALGKFKNNILK